MNFIVTNLFKRTYFHGFWWTSKIMSIEMTSHFFPLTYRYRWQRFEHRLGMNVFGGEQLRKAWGTFWEHPCEHDENNIGNKGEPLPPKEKTRPLIRRECPNA
jgi:hypothetical protein